MVIPESLNLIKIVILLNWVFKLYAKKYKFSIYLKIERNKVIKTIKRIFISKNLSLLLRNKIMILIPTWVDFGIWKKAFWGKIKLSLASFSNKLTKSNVILGSYS